MWNDETRGLGLAFMRFAESVKRADAEVFDAAVQDAYATLDKEAEQTGKDTVRLGLEFMELVEAAK